MKGSFGDECYSTIKYYPVPLVGSNLGSGMNLRVVRWGLESLRRKYMISMGCDEGLPE